MYVPVDPISDQVEEPVATVIIQNKTAPNTLYVNAARIVLVGYHVVKKLTHSFSVYLARSQL